MFYQAIIKGCGSYLPSHCVSNTLLCEQVDTSDEWIFKRTGIKQRHLAAEGEKTSDLATQAALLALENAELEADEIDLIIVATTTPDLIFPGTAVQVQANLKSSTGYAFDIQAVCSGFVYALAVAQEHMRLGRIKHALIIGAETMSHLLDWQDRSTCVLFGDGAGAITLSAKPMTAPQEKEFIKMGRAPIETQGILWHHLRSNGKFSPLLYVDGGPGSTFQSGFIKMQGRDVFKHAVEKMSESIQEVLNVYQIDASAIDWFVPHQANQRILEAVAEKLDLPCEKMIMTVGQHANTSAASVPLALDTAFKAGKIQPGHLILCEALGAGFHWGACLFRW